MTAYISLSEIPRGLFAAAFTLIALACAAVIILRARGKKAWKAALYIPFAAAALVIWYALTAINSAAAKGEETTGLVRLVGSLPWLAVAGACVVMLAAAAFFLRLAVSAFTGRAGEYAVLEGLDSMDSGVCCCREDGEVLVMNRAMEELCYELFDHVPLNGYSLLKLLYDREDDDGLIRLSDGRVVTANTDAPEKKAVRCIIAREVSKEYELNESVNRADAELESLTAALANAGREAVSFVTAGRALASREGAYEALSEALKLCEAAAGDGGEEEKASAREAVLSALALFDTSKGSGDAGFAACMTEAASRLGLELEAKGSLPRDSELREAALDAAAGYITAALRYAPDEKHSMEIREGTWVYEIVFSTFARLPESAVNAMGLDAIAQRAGGTLTVSGENGTELFMRFRLNRTSR